MTEEPKAQNLFLLMGTAFFAVSVVISVVCATMGVMSGMLVAYGSLLVATVVLFAYILRFIGPESHFDDGDAHAG